MKNFLIKLGLFVLPFLIAVGLELFVLPIDFFTFRAWESLRVEGTTITPGKFYPMMTLTKNETGRDAHHTRYAVPRNTTWITDQYGYRNRVTDRHIEVVLIGDSFIAGDGIDQNQLLSEQLESRLDQGVYSIAPGDISDFLNLPRFCDTPPHVVILQKVEATIDHLRKPKIRNFKQSSWRFRQHLSKNAFVRYIDRVQNRSTKAIMLNFFKARIRDWMGMRSFDENNVRQLGSKFFVVPNPGRQDELKMNSIDKVVSTLVMYKKILSEKNIRFVFMPVPDKSTTYHNLVDSEISPAFIDRLVQASRQAGIETVDLYTVFQNTLQTNPDQMFYLQDDSHWNETGVSVAADLIAQMLSSKTSFSKK